MLYAKKSLYRVRFPIIARKRSVFLEKNIIHAVITTNFTRGVCYNTAMTESRSPRVKYSGNFG